MPVETSPKTGPSVRFFLLSEALAEIATQLGRPFARNEFYYLLHTQRVRDDFQRVGPFRLFSDDDLDRITEAAGKLRPYRRKTRGSEV